MKLLLIVDVYPPIAQAAAIMMHDLAIALTAQGHNITVLTPSAAIHSNYRKEEQDDVTILRVKAPDFKNISRDTKNPLTRQCANIRRGLTEGRLSKIIWTHAGEYLRKNRHDAIIYYTPSIFFGDLVMRLKTLWDAPSYMILRDIFPQWLIDTGEISPYHPGLWYLHRKEQINYDAADIIAVQSPANKLYFADKPERHKLDVLYNWTDNHRKRPHTGKYRKKLGYSKEDIIFFFGGAFTEAQDMDNLLRLAKNMEDTPRAKFLFIGKGTKYETLETAIKNGNHKNVTLRPAVDHDMFLNIMADIDIGLITLAKNLKTHNLPGKLLDYLSYGTPVLASINKGNDLADIIVNSGAGYAFENGDDMALSEAAHRLAKSETLRIELSKNATKLQKKNFGVSQAATQIIAALLPLQTGSSKDKIR